MQSSFTFELDGETYHVDGEPISRTLAEYLHRCGFGREDRFRQPDPWLSGSPLVLLDTDGKGRPALRSVDASLLLLPAVAGRRLWSAEGLVRRAALGDTHPALNIVETHPELECTWSGRARMLTAFFEGYYRADLQTAGQLNDQLDGCLSRTANYSMLRQVADALFTEAQQRRHEAEERAKSEGKEAELKQGRIDAFGDEFSALLASEISDLEEFSYVDVEKRRFYRPLTIVDLAKLLAQFPKAIIVGGSAGLLQKGSSQDWDCLISTDGVGDLRALYEHEDRWVIGAAAPLTSVNEIIGSQYPAFRKILRRFGNRTMRNRITLGGYLASARPDSELAPVLIALEAQVRVISLDGERDIPVGRFIEGPGKTNLRPSEVVADIVLPRFTESVLKKRGCKIRLCDTYKTSPRREMGGNSVTGGFAVELDEKGKITQAWIAYSGVAELPFRAKETEKALAGKTWSEDTIFGVLKQLTEELQSAPGANSLHSGIGKTEIEYREQLPITLFQKFFYQHAKSDGSTVELGAISAVVNPDRRLFQPSGIA